MITANNTPDERLQKVHQVKFPLNTYTPSDPLENALNIDKTRAVASQDPLGAYSAPLAGIRGRTGKGERWKGKKKGGEEK